MTKKKVAENSEITWSNGTRHLSELIPWGNNPRDISKDQQARLNESFREFGQPETIAIGPGNQLYNGHQRLKSWLEEFGNIEIDVRISSRSLTEQEQKKLTIILHKGATGEFIQDKLSEVYELEELTDWGYPEVELELDLWGVPDEKYTRNVEAPIYTPNGKKPKIIDLYDDTKTDALIAEIDASDLSPAVKKFLRIAAQRHTVLNFERIADFYAHASKDLQGIMENSALVIIDFDRAIELGYVKLSDKIAGQYKEDYLDG